MNYPHPIIAREGWPFIAIAAVVALLVHAFAGFGFAWIFWLILIFVVQFFRDPARPIPTQANAKVAQRAVGRWDDLYDLLDNNPAAQAQIAQLHPVQWPLALPRERLAAPSCGCSSIRPRR